MNPEIPARSSLHSPEFVFGVATSSLQIEGAADKRLPSIWDRFCEVPGAISDASNCKDACDHYGKWSDDVELIASLGVDAYRFSVCWPRVINADGSGNQDGLDFYLRLLDALNARGINPFVTLYHWELPQYLEDAGGWPVRDTAYRYRDYVDIVTRAFGDRVYSYATLNEPYCSAHLGYETGVHAPGHTSKACAMRASHNLLVAHGLAMQVLRGNSPTAMNGTVLNFTPAYPATDKAEDIAAAALADQFVNHWYIKPILDGCYPEAIESLSDDERPEIAAGDFELISAPLDFLGVNYYTRANYRADPQQQYVDIPPTAENLTDMGWEIFPEGLTDLLVSLNETYRLPPLYITENGAAMPDQFERGAVRDMDRIDYLRRHIDAVDAAIAKGVDVRGYFCWSLMDNFEWALGYTKRFGLVHVDYETQQRTLKASGHAFRDMISGRKSSVGEAGQA